MEPPAAVAAHRVPRGPARFLRTAWLLLAGLAVQGCAAATGAGPRTRLSPDSAAVLRRAIQAARPAYPSQDQALRAGVYSAAPPSAAPPTPAAAAFVIQIAAFRDAAYARAIAAGAAQVFPELSVLVDVVAGVHRVALSGWPTQAAAEAILPRVRSRYPGAWIRNRSLP